MIDLTNLITAKDKEQAAYEQACASARRQRDELLDKAAGRRDRHRDEVELGLNPTEPLEPLLQAIQALRDVPQQEGFPYDIDWPVIPLEEL